MFHKEGFNIIIVTFFLTAGLSVFSEYYIESEILKKSIQITSLFTLILILQFVRNPKRKTKQWLNSVRTWTINEAKWKSANEFCLDHNMEFKILTEDHLNPKYK